MEAEILQRLRDSEINGEIEWFYDTQFGFRLGDKVNGCKGFLLDCTFAEGVQWIANEAAKHYPESDFTKWWKE